MDESPKVDREYSARWSEFWRVTQRTIQRWRKDHAGGAMPCAPDDVEGMLRWSLSPGRKPPEFLRRCAELRLKREARSRAAAGGASPEGSPTPAGFADPDWVAFTAQQHAGAPKDQAAQIQDLEAHLAFADFALKRARQRGDEHAQKKYTDELIKWSKAVKEQKLLADRLGLDSGDLLPRSTVELFISAHMYWTMRSVDMSLDALSKRLVNLSFPEEARSVLEPELLSMRCVSAYARAAQVASRNALPPWALSKIRDAVDDFIEHGAAHFDELFAAPAAEPTAPAIPPPMSPVAASVVAAGNENHD